LIYAAEKPTPGLGTKKPGALSLEKGNPAILLGPVAFRPHLAMGLALTLIT
jgi:hypothetical protein